MALGAPSCKFKNDGDESASSAVLSPRGPRVMTGLCVDNGAERSETEGGDSFGSGMPEEVNLDPVLGCGEREFKFAIIGDVISGPRGRFKAAFVWRSMESSLAYFPKDCVTGLVMKELIKRIEKKRRIVPTRRLTSY